MNISLGAKQRRTCLEGCTCFERNLGEVVYLSPSLLSCRCWETFECSHVLAGLCVLTKSNRIFHRFQGLSLTSDMKPAHHTLFRDQVSTLVDWFGRWNECEQTIALYTLLKRISTIQAKFLSLILEHTFREDSFEVQMMQRRANDKGRQRYFCLSARGRVTPQPFLFYHGGNFASTSLFDRAKFSLYG